MKLGDRIAGWRQFKGLSQRELAEAIGVTPPAVYQWEEGLTTPGLVNLEKLVEQIGISMERFYSRNSPKPKKDAA